MGGSTAKGLFLVNMAVIGVIAVLGVYQVPQPWRGILVAWLLFFASAGTFVLGLLRHHREYRSMQMRSGSRATRRTARRRGRSRQKQAAGDLQVITSGQRGGGRHVIR